MPATQPRPEQLENLAKRAPDGPLYMLNLLKFKERAEYADGRETDLTGRQAYNLYSQGVIKLILALGGKPIYFGLCNALLIGDGDESPWDSVGVIEYPSIEAFQKMTSSAGYADVHVHRDAGLEHQVLINMLSIEQAMAAAGAS
ncbi:MAG: DUF1330 domain-containing protein [Deltaproteobacteria bacterium]|nr:DUF1330 domain-containing protein [Deltaproteobacteria bacterium]MBW2416087.1 DUF1330 domain-containing protein [Deltaproteobacteria bacterium]